jgi:hypothetical protein
VRGAVQCPGDFGVHPPYRTVMVVHEPSCGAINVLITISAAPDECSNKYCVRSFCPLHTGASEDQKEIAKKKKKVYCTWSFAIQILSKPSVACSH